MKRLIIVAVLPVLLFCACKKNPAEGVGNNGAAATNASGGQMPVGSSTTAARKPAAGDRVLYMYDEYHFYEADLVSMDGARAKLKREGETVERDASDVYPIPKAGDEITVKPGDFVAARYGNLPTWPTAEVIKVDAGKITVKRIVGGGVDEVAPENVLAVSPAAAARIRDAAKKG
jgi:hypothetical protein